jgi:hypothetical protein
MSKEIFHGWTNYATWRVNLELLNDIDFDDQVTAESLQEIVEDIVFTNETAKGLIEDYARAFINQVNFFEIAETINKELE